MLKYNCTFKIFHFHSSTSAFIFINMLEMNVDRNCVRNCDPKLNRNCVWLFMQDKIRIMPTPMRAT